MYVFSAKLCYVLHFSLLLKHVSIRNSEKILGGRSSKTLCAYFEFSRGAFKNEFELKPAAAE